MTENGTATETETIIRLQYTDLRLDPVYIAITCWGYLVVMYVIPFMVLIILNWRYESWWLLNLFNSYIKSFIKDLVVLIWINFEIVRWLLVHHLKYFQHKHHAFINLIWISLMTKFVLSSLWQILFFYCINVSSFSGFKL